MKTLRVIIAMGISLGLVVSLSACSGISHKNQAETAAGTTQEMMQSTEQGTEQQAGQTTEQGTDQETGQQSVQEWSSNLLQVATGHVNVSLGEPGLYREIQYPQVSLLGVSKDRYPQLQETLNELNKCTNALGDALYIRRGDDAILSLLIENHDYTVAAHPYCIYYCYNIQSKTGESLNLSQVLAEPEKLGQNLVEELETKNPDYASCLYDELDLSNYVDEYMDELTWVMDYSGLTIIFNPYEIGEIGTYSYTATVVTLPFQKYKNLVKEEYTSLSDHYAVELLDSDLSYFVDLNGDGETEALQYGLSYGGESNSIKDLRQLSFGINDNYYVDGSGCNKVTSYLMVNNGGYYIYSELIDGNDCTQTFVYQIDADAVTKFQNVGRMDSGFEYICLKTTVNDSVEPDNYAVYGPCVADPDCFNMTSRIGVLSHPCDGIKTYSVGENGLPVSEEAFYSLGGSIEFTLKKDFTFTEVNPETFEETGEAQLKKGTSLSYCYTDNNTIAYLKSQDGIMYKLVLDSDKAPQTVNGTEIEMLFDGVHFAG